MKKILFILLTCSSLISFSQAVEMKNERDSASYAAGLNEGQRMEEMLIQAGADTILNKKLFLQGFVDFMNHASLMDANACQKVLMSFFGRMQEELMKEQAMQDSLYMAKFEAKKAESIAFLADNKTKKGIEVTETGLQYRVDKKGKGKKIMIGDRVKVHYTGSFVDGTKFDSSLEGDGTPFELELKELSLIPGWIEALQLMNKGAKYTIYLPWELGYGEQGQSPSIPPYSVLIFEIEVVDHIKTQK